MAEEGGGRGPLLAAEAAAAEASEESPGDAERCGERSDAPARPWLRPASLLLLSLVAFIGLGFATSDLWPRGSVRGRATGKAFQERSLEEEGPEGSEGFPELTAEDLEHIMPKYLKKKFADLMEESKHGVSESAQKFGKDDPGVSLYGRILDLPSGPSPAVPFYFCGAGCPVDWVCCNYGRLCAPPGSKCCGTSFVSRGAICCNYDMGLICGNESKCCGQRLCCAPGFQCGYAQKETEGHPHVRKQPQCGTGPNLSR